MPDLSDLDHNYAKKMPDLSVSDDNNAKKIAILSSNNNESGCYHEEIIKDLLIPIKTLRNSQIKIFLCDGPKKINVGIISEETEKLLNSIPKETIFYKKIYKAIKIVEVITVFENSDIFFVNNDIFFGKIGENSVDNLTNVPFDHFYEMVIEMKILNTQQSGNETIRTVGFEDHINQKVSEKVLGISFVPLKILYEDMLKLLDEVKKNSNIKKLFRNFMCAMAMKDGEFLKIVEMMDNNFSELPNPLLKQYERNFIKLSEFYELNIHLEVIYKLITTNQVIISQVLEKIRNIDLMNEELLKKFFIKLDNLKNPIYVRYIKNEIMKFDIKSKIGFDPNENKVDSSYLDKKYQYLMMYHKYLKIFIGELDFKKIKKFFEEQNDLRKNARLKEISEYKTKLDKKRREDLQMKSGSQKKVRYHERMDLNGLETKDAAQKKEIFFTDIESEVEYEKSESDCLRRSIIIKMLEIMHSVEYLVDYDINKLYEENKSLNIGDFIVYNRLIPRDLYNYKNSPCLGTSNNDHKEFLLRLDYEAARISALKDRLDVGIRKISALIDSTETKAGDTFLRYNVKLKKCISYKNFIQTFLYQIVILKRRFECFFVEYSDKLTGNIHLLSEEEIILIKGNFKCKTRIENGFIVEFKDFLDS